MPSPDSKTRARAELVDLIESQLNTLEKETFGCIAEAELREYEGRRDRISQLYTGTHRPRSRRVACSGCWEEINK